MTGAGTLADPWVIWDVNDLQDVGNGAPYLLGDYYELGQDIDATATAGWNWNAGRGVFEGFNPIGQWGVGNQFTGHFNGNGYTISNLYMDWYKTAESVRVGLFGVIVGTGVIQNLLIVDADITGYARGDTIGCQAGVLVGHLHGATVRNVLVFGTLSGTTWDTTVPRVHGASGGLVGFSTTASLVERCAAYVDVSGWREGFAYTHVGGFVGRCDAGTIRNCYARGSVTGSENKGGFCGTGSGTISNCYSTGAVLVGSGFCAGGACAACFWDIETSGQSTSSCGTGATTAQMKTQSTFTDAGWDFVTIWDIDGIWNDGYPFFRWDTLPHINITVPNGGEVWDAGSTYTILWTYTAGSRDPGTHVNIELLKAGVLDAMIIASTPIGPPGGGNYNWTIGSGKTPGHDYRVRVTGVTHPYTDTSDDDFKIRGPIVPPPAPAVATLPATGVG